MAKIYGGHLVARHLKEKEGVDTIFSLSGGHIDRIYDGCFQYGVRLVDVRHEQAAAMMAHSWSIYAGKPGVCLVTAGPGFTNAITGIVNAHLENAPLVVISGTAPVRDWGKGALQEMDQEDMIKPFVKWCHTCHSTARIPEAIAAAFRHAVNGRPGPVFLQLPPDILNVSIDEEAVVPAGAGSKIYGSLPDEASLKEAARLINKAKRPVIMGGSGVGLSPCEKSIREFVEKSGIPFFFLNAGRGVLPDNHPLSLWDGTQTSMFNGAAQADVIVALGLRFNWLLLFGQGFVASKVIRVDVDATELNRNREADVGLCGDINLTLEALNPMLEKREHSSWLESLRQASAPEVQANDALKHTPKDPIHPFRLMEAVRQVVGDDAIYILDGGDTSYFGIMGFTATSKASVLGAASGLLGCLGTGLPFGIAAKLACPDKTVVVVSGDGSFGFNAMEFDTALRHNAPVLCVICNDQAWGMIKHGQEICYGCDRLIGSELGVIHYEGVAKALGAHGELVEKDSELVPALKRALESGRPACVNVLTDPTVTSPATLLFSQSLKME
ncbi:MAG: thiamine pyrophosphate-binding protein [Desulfatibacillaceae bacterium]|nr:thiamine pyrophosphate-binding protein [Desulfatibacillaceae bacterium]